MSIAHRLNHQLSAWLGLRKNGAPSSAGPVRRHGTGRPLFIDLIGGSGVGKSTLYAAMERQRGNRWLSPAEVLARNPAAIGDRHVPTDHLSLIQAKLDTIASTGFNAWSRMSLIAFYRNNLLQELRVRAAHTDATVVFEDGLLHNYSVELAALHDADPAAFRRLVAGRAVVHCHLAPEENAHRIRQREQAIGQVRPQHQVGSFAELVAVAARAAAERKRLAELLAAAGVPMLHICTSDSLEGNVRQVNAFIAQVQAAHVPPKQA